MCEQTAKERYRLWRRGLVAGCNNEQRALLLWRQIEMIARRVHREPRRTRVELKRGAAEPAVQPAIFEHNVGTIEQFAGDDAAARMTLTPHLEQIGEIVVEQQRQIEICGIFAVILHANALIR